MKYASIDIETTGLDPDVHDIVEFGCVLDDLENPEVPVDELPSFHCYNVLDNYVGSPFALSMHPDIFRRIATRDEDQNQGLRFCYNGRIGEEFHNFLSAYKIRRDIHAKFHLTCAGKNFSSFDLQFINKKTDISRHKIKLQHRALDPSPLYLLPNDESLPGTETCLERAGIEKDVAHTAIEDAKDIIKLVRVYFHGCGMFPNLVL
jgi:DNA polymerase III epsilon subunit-like protein